MNANELIKTPGLEDRLGRLRGRYEVTFTKAFDTGESRAAKSWKSNYAVLDLVAVLPAKASGIPDDLYLEALEVFKIADQALGRARTFFCLRLVPRLKGPSWSLELFLQDRDLLRTHTLVLEVAKPIVELMLKNAEFRKSCSDGPHLLVAYSERDKRVIGFQSQLPVTFDQSYSQSTKVEQELMSDNCGKNITGMSGVFLGNVGCARDDYRAASEHWRRAADAGVKDAPFCVAVASVQLGDMEQAFEFCKRAIQVGDPPSRLNDPELAEFRRHPLFAKLKEWIAARRGSRPRMAKPAVPSPTWTIPKNIGKLVKEEGGMWEDDRFDPILLAVMSGTSYHGRDIPLAWQIEFDPFDDRLETANEKIEASGIEPDGDGWSGVIEKEFVRRYPKLAGEFHTDSESDTCVVWVESEVACQKLIQLVWSLINPTSRSRS